MPRYRVVKRDTGKVYEVEAPFAQTACDMLGTDIAKCEVELMSDGPFTRLSERPKVVRKGAIIWRRPTR